MVIGEAVDDGTLRRYHKDAGVEFYLGNYASLIITCTPSRKKRVREFRWYGMDVFNTSF